MKRTSSPVAYCALSAKCGTRDEEPAYNGLAHFTEHMFFKGTAAKRATAINNTLERVGGELNAYTTKEETVLHATVLREDLPKAIDLLMEIAFTSTFPQKELQKEREVIYEEITSYKDIPADCTFVTGFAVCCGVGTVDGSGKDLCRRGFPCAPCAAEQIRMGYPFRSHLVFQRFHDMILPDDAIKGLGAEFSIQSRISHFHSPLSCGVSPHTPRGGHPLDPICETPAFREGNRGFRTYYINNIIHYKAINRQQKKPLSFDRGSVFLGIHTLAVAVSPHALPASTAPSEHPYNTHKLTA